MWRAIEPEGWEVTGNPWLILQGVSRRRIETLANDLKFLAALRHQLEVRRDYLAQPTWFAGAHAEAVLGTIAYFSMEFDLSEAIPIYSVGVSLCS